jgi:DNA-binding NtrC family response regulator
MTEGLAAGIMLVMSNLLSALIVDSSACVSKELPSLLEEMGHRVLFAATGNAALQLIEREQPQIVVADLHMPDMDGLAFVEILRSRDPYITTIVLSERSSLDRAQEAIRRGGWDYLVKPIQRDELERAVKGALERATLLL